MKIKTPQLKRIHLTIPEWWLVLLASAFVLTILLTLHAIFLFIHASSADVVTESTEIPVESLSREALKERVAAFEARINRYESIKANYAGVSDPSL
jgi:hypothetical protein